MPSKQNKNIAYYIGDYTRSGGTERVCTSVANGLARKATNTIYLITTNKPSEKPFFEINPEVKVLYLNIDNCKKQYLQFLYRLSRALRKNKIDIIVAVEVMSLLFVLPVYLGLKLRKGKTKLVVWEHFNFTVNLGLKLRDRCRKWAARYADQIVVLTKRDVTLWEENLKIKNNITSINNIAPFPISKKKYHENSTNIIAVGRLSYQKGFDRLIEIWSMYLKKYPVHKNWKLQIIGSGVDKDMLENKIEEYNLRDNIEMIANTSNIASYYENAAFLAMTSRFEGLPMTLIEAQSFGLPIIAYDCLTGPSEVITEESGFLIENGCKKDFIEKINTLLINSNLRINMGLSGRKEVFRFSENNVLEKWVALFDEIQLKA